MPFLSRLAQVSDSALKSVIKSTLFKLFPRTATRLFSIRSRKLSHRLVEGWGCTALNRKLFGQFGSSVLHGPFKGIVLTPETQREHLAPYLLGVYESELHDIWKTVFRMNFSQIIDVGAKFGFYAVALARQFPGVPVLAFDTDPWAQQATEEMIAGNGVKVRVMDYCNPDWLRGNLVEGAFIMSDCEGYEATLFGDSAIPALSSATMLIELHEEMSPGVTCMMQEKYCRSHEISIITARTDALNSLRELDGLTMDERKMALNEYRTADQSWIFLKPRSAPTADLGGQGLQCPIAKS